MRTVLLVLGMAALAGCVEQRAEHVWALELEPLAPGAYRLEVPFLVYKPGVRDAESPDPALAALRDRLEVTAGDATFSWIENGTVLAIGAGGPATLEARNAFHAPVEQREAFTRWQLPHALVVRPAPGPPVNVTWQIDFSGGKGHTCWADAMLWADVPADDGAMLRRADGDSVEFWAVACA